MLDKTASYKQQIYKQASFLKKEKKDPNRTRFVKDRVMSAARSEGDALKGGAIAGAVGAGMGMATSLATGKATKALNKAIGLPTQGSKIYKFMTSPEMRKARLGVGAAMGATRLAPKGAKAGRVVGDMNTLEKKTRKELGREPSEKEYRSVARLDYNNRFDRKLGRLLNTPEAIVKSNKREA